MPSIKFFEGEKWLVVTGVVGIVLAIVMAIAIYFRGPIVMPEGNLQSAFSFNAAIGIYILSIAAIFPLAMYNARKRRIIRRLFIAAVLCSYGIENIQHLRGINPRFSVEGSSVDMIAGILFGVISVLLVILAILLMVRFFNIRSPHVRPTLITALRYAFISIFIGNVAGLWMIALQGRFTGDMGNLIVLHGIGFHALQTIVLPAWFLEKAQINDQLKKWLIHFGSVAWLISILFIGLQTLLGRSVFEFSIYPVLAIVFLFIWLGASVFSLAFYIIEKQT